MLISRIRMQRRAHERTDGRLDRQHRDERPQRDAAFGSVMSQEELRDVAAYLLEDLLRQ
jgi:hypothetical protein